MLNESILSKYEPEAKMITVSFPRAPRRLTLSFKTIVTRLMVRTLFSSPATPAPPPTLWSTKQVSATYSPLCATSNHQSWSV